MRGATETTRIYTDRDSHIRISDPTTNFGGQGLMWVGLSSTTEVAYIHFDLTDMPDYEPVGLVLDFFYIGSTAVIEVYTTSNSWTEYGITYNNAPGSITLVGNHTIPDDGRYTLDIGTILDGKTEISFIIATTTSEAFTITSKDYDYLWDDEDKPNIKFTKEVADLIFIVYIVAGIVIVGAGIGALKVRSSKKKKFESRELK